MYRFIKSFMAVAASSVMTLSISASIPENSVEADSAAKVAFLPMKKTAIIFMTALRAVYVTGVAEELQQF